MPPKQETHSERISALEGQIGGFSTAIDELCDATTKSERSILEASAKNDRNRTPNGSEGSPRTAEPLRYEKGILQVPEKAIPLRSAELSTPSYHGVSSGYSPQQKIESPPKKLELPDFVGKNPDDWIFRVEKCFSVNQTEEDEKLSLAMASMVGGSVTWLRMIHDHEKPSDWGDFKNKLRRHFKATRGGTILSAEVPHVPNDVLEEIFLHGMKRSLREQVVRLRPLGMDEIVEMAQIIEVQENERSSYQSRSFHRTNSAPTLHNHQRSSSNSSGGKQSETTPARKSFDSQHDNKGCEQKKTIHNPCRHCGDPDLLCAQVSLRAIEKLCEKEDGVYLLELQALFDNGETTDKAVVTVPAIKKLPKEYNSVFNMPSGLPPKRSREHAITLQEGTSPINIRPYQLTEFKEFQLTAPLSIDMDELALQVERDEALQAIINGVSNGDQEFDGYSVKEGVLFKDRCLVIPTNSPFIPAQGLLEQVLVSSLSESRDCTA
ncbi:hypothetical protein Bca52824_085590 [Brassica carinata]|uniref:Ty3 transposon capsid-like protein domain-containing protein n=1 Tax=Brassica carinata TaxID=52824 RepID=A0A8X7P836_BRACI|nr:hypothetical protein Bca52824_085590 [Brassica carinata]